MIVNLCPEVSNLSETISSLEFSSRVCNVVVSLGHHYRNPRWSGVGNYECKELYEKDKKINDLKQELKEANDQIFNEVQKAWKVLYTVQSDLKSENIMLVEKYRIEKDQNAQLRNQVSHLLHVEQEQKVQI